MATYKDSFGNTVSTNDPTLAGTDQSLNVPNQPTAPQTNTAQPVDTSQPQPTPTNPLPTVNPAPPTGVQGTLPGQTTPTTFTSADVMKQYGANPITEAFNAVKDTPAPQDSGTAAGGVSGALKNVPQPPTNQTPPEIESFFQTNKVIQPSLQELAEFLSPASTRKALEESMTKITDSMGEKAGLNLELADTKRIMEGTDQDIRDEIEKAGGFGTESQIAALTIGRNKTLLKRANLIVDQLNHIQDVINTDLTMYGFQKDMANQEFQQRSFLLQYKQENDRMVYQATQDAINRNIELFGVDGLYNAAQGDPVKIDRLERAMGLMPGGLLAAVERKRLESYADYSITTPYIIQPSGQVENTQTGEAYTSPEDFQARTGMTLDQAGQLGLIKPLGLTKDDIKDQRDYNLDLAKYGLDQDKFQFEIDKFNYEIENPEVNTQVVESGGKKLLINSDTGEIIKEISAGTGTTDVLQQSQAKANIDQISGLAQDKGLNSAVGPNAIARGGITLPFGIKIPTTFRGLTGERQNFISGVEQLVDQLNLDKLIQSKAQGATFGALSDNELRVLASAATKIGTWRVKDKDGKTVGYNINEKAFRQELDKINNFAKLDYILKGGNPQEVGVTQTEDGNWVTPNSDGSFTEFDELKNKQSFNSAGNASASIGKIATAIGQYESGGNYKARGPVVTSGQYRGERALGKYQIMPGNLPSWSKAALGRVVSEQEFLNSPKIQDQIAQHKMAQIYKSHSTLEDVASIWFSGRPVVKAGKAKDVIGTTVPKYIANIRAIYNKLT